MFSTSPAPSDSLASTEPQAPLLHGGVATGAFSRSAAPAPPMAGSGPSEFTRMFAAPKPAAPATAPAPAPKPAPPAVKPEKSPLILVLVLAGLLVLVVVVILVFVLTR